MSDTPVDEIVKQLVHNNSTVVGVVIAKQDCGVVVRSTLTQALAAHYVALYLPLLRKTKRYLDEVHQAHELESVRVRSRKHEIIACEREGYIVLAIHQPCFD